MKVATLEHNLDFIFFHFHSQLCVAQNHILQLVQIFLGIFALP